MASSNYQTTAGGGIHIGGGEDTTYTKVFVGGLAWETQSPTLRRYFEQFGDIFEAVVITDKNTGRSKGYGFVTFYDPESARRACVDPSPVIDGRRANCNLASLGRPQPSVFFGEITRATHRPDPNMSREFERLRPVNELYGSLQSPKGGYNWSPGYQQPVSYNYQPGLAYQPYGYTAYGPEYVYPQFSQGIYNPYVGQQYLPIYGLPGTVSSSSGVYPYGQLRQPMPAGQGYSALQGYAMPGHNIMQVTRPNVTGAPIATFSTVQASYTIGIAAPNPVQTQIILRPPKTTQTGVSDQTVG